MGRPLRIVFFTAHYHPHRGGIERYVDRFAAALERYGCESRIVTSTISSKRFSETVNGIPVYRIPTLNILGSEFPIPYPSRRLRAVERMIEEFAPDVIITNTRYFPTSALGIRIGRTLGIRTLHLDHGSDYASLSNPLLDPLARLVDRLIGGYVLTRADRCAAVSHDVARFIERAFERRCELILPNAIDPVPKTRRKGSRLVYGYAGRLIEEKGVLLLIDAFRAVKRSHPQARLRIAGTGPLTERIRNEPGIDYVGLLGPEEMRAFYASVDVFVYPTWYREGFATAILEAAVNGTLLITTARGSARELIPDDSYGLIVPERDRAALISAMETYATPQPAVARRLRERVLERFTWDATARTAYEVLSTW